MVSALAAPSAVSSAAQEVARVRRRVNKKTASGRRRQQQNAPTTASATSPTSADAGGAGTAKESAPQRIRCRTNKKTSSGRRVQGKLAQTAGSTRASVLTNSVSQRASTAQPSSAAAVDTLNTKLRDSNTVRRPVFDDQFASSADGAASHTQQQVQPQGPAAVADQTAAALAAGDLDLAEALLDEAEGRDLLHECRTEAGRQHTDAPTTTQLTAVLPKLLTDDAGTTVLEQCAPPPPPRARAQQQHGTRRGGGLGCCGGRPPAPAA
jgi:hypothetical protein